MRARGARRGSRAGRSPGRARRASGRRCGCRAPRAAARAPRARRRRWRRTRGRCRRRARAAPARPWSVTSRGVLARAPGAGRPRPGSMPATPTSSSSGLRLDLDHQIGADVAGADDRDAQRRALALTRSRAGRRAAPAPAGARQRHPREAVEAERLEHAAAAAPRGDHLGERAARRRRERHALHGVARRDVRVVERAGAVDDRQPVGRDRPHAGPLRRRSRSTATAGTTPSRRSTIVSIRRRSSRLLTPLNSIVPPIRMQSPNGVQPTWTSASRIACVGTTVGRTAEAVALARLHRQRDRRASAASARRPRAGREHDRVGRRCRPPPSARASRAGPRGRARPPRRPR